MRTCWHTTALGGSFAEAAAEGASETNGDCAGGMSGGLALGVGVALIFSYFESSQAVQRRTSEIAGASALARMKRSFHMSGTFPRPTPADQRVRRARHPGKTWANALAVEGPRH
jgi:hypothetical protein